MATKVNLVVDQGATFTTTISLTNDDGSIFDLQGYTGKSQLAKHYTSNSKTDIDVSLANTAPATGVVTLSMSSNTTSDLLAGRYVYDLELTDEDGVISRIVEGIITVTPQVTST